LVKELRLAGIATMEVTNIFPEQSYLPKMNDRFSVPPPEKKTPTFPSGMLTCVIFSVLRRNGL
jgi:hypothetical protein